MAVPSILRTREKTKFVAEQLQFANTLASNDPKLRDRAMRKLRKYFGARARGSFSFSHDDFMRICKGLFYCMWMSDKPLIQEDLAEQISQLVHCFKRETMELMFVQSVFDTLIIEWFGIDYHRMDKFQLFVRRFLRQCLVYCKSKDWKKVAVTGLCEVFQSTVLSPNCINECVDMTLVMHFVEIFVEELAKVSGGVLPMDMLLEFLKPFITNLMEQDDPRIQRVIRDKVFFCLIRQSQQGMEYEEKFEAWKRAGFPGTSWKQMVFVGKNDKRSGVKLKHLDPRAGLVNVYLPHLQFDATAVAEMLRKYADKTSNHGCQKFIEKIASRFQILAEDNYPFTTNVSKKLRNSNKYRFSKQKINDAAESLLNFNIDLQKASALKRGKRKKNNSDAKLKHSKKIKLENWIIEESSNKYRENSQELELNSDQEKDEKNNDPAVSFVMNSKKDKLNILTSQEKNGDLSSHENGTLNINEQMKYEESEECTKEYRSQVNNLSSKNVKKKKIENMSPWSISEIPIPNGEIHGSQKECEEVEKDNLSEHETGSKDIDCDNKTKSDTSSHGTPTDELQIMESDVVQEVIEKNEDESAISSEILKSLDLIRTDSVLNSEFNNVQEKEIQRERIICEIVPNDKEILTPRRSTRRSNMIQFEEKNVKEKEINTPVQATQTPVQATPTPQRCFPRRSSELSSSNYEEEEVEEQFSEDESTPTKRKLFNPFAVLRGKGRVSKAPDREIPGVHETSEQEDSVSDTSTDESANSDESLLNNESNKVFENCGIVDEQEDTLSTPRRILRSKRPPMKRRVSPRTQSSTKKVNIDLQMNRTQEALEYEAAVKQSPLVPHDANKKPCKGVLKRTSIQSPINPFYVLPKGLKGLK